MKSLKAKQHGIVRGAFEILALCLMMLCFNYDEFHIIIE